MQIKLGNTTKAYNSTKKVDCTKLADFVCKEDTVDVLNPVLEVLTDGQFGGSDWNYAHIPDFNDRYYWINDITPLTARTMRLGLSVDLLGTYRDKILASQAFVTYAQSSYNTMIPDSRLPISDSCQNLYYEYPFPQFSQEGSFVINIASKDADGSIGMAQSFVTDSSGIRNFASILFNKDKLEQLLQYYNNPLDMVINAIWLPIGSLFLMDGHTTATLGDSDISFSGYSAKKAYQSAISFNVELPYKAQLPNGGYTYADYRNVEPYTQYAVTLPGVGVVTIPMSTYIKDGSALPEVRFNYVISPLDGGITYEMVDGDTVVAMFTGNLSVPVPLANTAYNTMGGISAYIKNAANIGMGVANLAVGNFGGALGGIGGGVMGMLSTFQKSEQAINSVNGRLGGFDGSRFCEKFKISVRPYEISDSPSNIANVIGRPLFARKTLSSLSGLCVCTGCYPKVGCTDKEYQALYSAINNSGGILIE